MKYRKIHVLPRLLIFIVAIATSTVSTHAVAAEEIPPGYFRMPDGRIMANNPATAIAPPGYYLRRNGVLIKLDPGTGNSAKTEPVQPGLKPGQVPAGFHRMPDGRIMANNPDTAIAPAGYHLMPDGVLMSNSGDHSGHHNHGGGGHHGAGMWMFDYVYTRMSMKNLLDTTDLLSPEEMFLAPYGFSMSPVDMTMDMHMLMAMYGVTDKVMVMLMGHYMSNSMTMLSDDTSGTRSVMNSSGLADTVVSAMVQLPYGFGADFGLSIPTGSVDVSGPMQHTADAFEESVKYPYGMQLGSGSTEFKPGIRYAGNKDMFGWGGNFEYTYRLRANKHDYKLGNQILAGGWLSIAPKPFVTLKALMNARYLEQIKGKDAALSPNMSPSMRASSQGGMRIDAGAELKLNTPGQMYSGALQLMVPVYQNLWGPQMATSWVASFKLGVMF